MSYYQQPIYGAPAPAYGAPAPAYGAPAPFPAYGAPAPFPAYGAPAPVAAAVTSAAPVMSAAPAAPVASAVYPAMGPISPAPYSFPTQGYVPYGGAPAFAQDPYANSPYGSTFERGYAPAPRGYRPRRNERYGEILYSAPIWDDRDDHADGRVPASSGTTAAPASSYGNWNIDIEVVAARGLPATMGGTFRKDKLDPYVLVKVGNQQANTREAKDAGSDPLFGDKLHFSGNGPRPTSGTLSVYDCDGELKAGASVPGKSDDLIGTANFNISQGDQNVSIQDPKKGNSNGTVTIRCY